MLCVSECVYIYGKNSITFLLSLSLSFIYEDISIDLGSVE